MPASQATIGLLNEYYGAMESNDPRRYGTYYADDMTLTFANSPTVPRQAAGRSLVSGKLAISGSARPRWTSLGRFQASASCGRTVLYSTR